jgi:hypothetical protein
MPEDPVLGKSLGKMIADLTDLILATKEPVKKKKLRAQHKKLSKKLQDLIDKTVPVDTVEYKTATAAVEEGNKAIRKAINDTAQAADAITKIAKAISAIAKLVAILAA